MFNLRGVAVGCLLVGIFFRFANIGDKLFWMDEVFTALRVSGYSMQEMKDVLHDGHPISLGELKTFQFRNEQRGPRDVISGLAAEDSHHPPMYFLSVRAWQAWFGSTLSSARYFSAVVSLLLFPALFWLCRELMPEQKQFGWVAVALAAVSPIHVVFAQQARPYALWSVLIVASTAALLRAMRLSSASLVEPPASSETASSWTASMGLAWCLYWFLMVMSLYTHVLSLGVALAHLIVFVLKRGKGRGQWYPFLAVGFLVLLAYAPWLHAIANAPPVQGFGKDVEQQASLFQTASRWGGVICRIVVDLGANPASSTRFKLSLVPVLLPVAAFITFSLYVTLRHSPMAFRILCGGIIVPFCLVFLGSQIFFDRHVATTRHLLPVLIFLQLSIAFALHWGLRSDNERFKKLAKTTMALVLALGAISCAIRLPAVLWWDQIPTDNSMTPAIIGAIQNAERPLVVSDAEAGRMSKLMFFHTISMGLGDHVVFQFVPPAQEPLSAGEFTDVFLINATPQLLEKGMGAYGRNAQQVNDRMWAWRVD